MDTSGRPPGSWLPQLGDSGRTPTEGTRFMLMAGRPYGETPIFNGPYVD